MIQQEAISRPQPTPASRLYNNLPKPSNILPGPSKFLTIYRHEIRESDLTATTMHEPPPFVGRIVLRFILPRALSRIATEMPQEAYSSTTRIPALLFLPLAVRLRQINNLPTDRTLQGFPSSPASWVRSTKFPPPAPSQDSSSTVCPP